MGMSAKSRAILAALLKFTDSNNLFTYSYGSPKAYDYEIGNYSKLVKFLSPNTSYDSNRR